LLSTVLFCGNKSPLRNFILVVAILALVKLSIHFAANANYGFHRDELLHLSVSGHLQWGYMEFPPFIAFVGKVSHALFDVNGEDAAIPGSEKQYTVFGARVMPTLSGVGILILCCLMAREMGGSLRAVFLAGMLVLSFLPFFRNHTLFQPVAFDQFFVVLAAYLIIRYLNTLNKNYLLWFGVVAGVGILNKYTFFLWGLAFTAALLSHNRAKVFRDKWIYIAGGISLLMFLPNLVWQWRHDFPLLLHQQKLQEVQLSRLDWWTFGVDQLQFPFTLILSMMGLYAVFVRRELRRYYPVGIFFVSAFALMWALHSKPYYFFAAYPVMFAAGAVYVENAVQRNWFPYAIGIVIFALTVPFIPMLTPVLPIEKFVSYKDLKPDHEGRYILTGDYADMFGWEEQVALIDSLYKNLDDEDRARCVIWTGNYGEAGAIKILGNRYGLPDPVCTHGSFWLFGPGDKKAEVCISIGVEEESVSRVFNKYKLVRMVRHRYAIDEEHNIPVYICNDPKIDFRDVWPQLKNRVFD
jgi:hypothetical protein